MIFDDLDRVYPVPPLGSERSFNLDVRRLGLPQVLAELPAVRLRLSLEVDMVYRLWLRERLGLLEERRLKLVRQAA